MTPHLDLLWIVWAMFWIVFQLGSLIGFIFIGLAAFKLNLEQMNVEACEFLTNFSVWDRQIMTISFSARFLPT
jgi:hypothetical protein